MPRIAHAAAWLLVAAAAVSFLLPLTVRSQQGIRCFAETGYCIGGRVREVWERGGGLSAFGLPITPLQEEPIEGQLRWVQWFERARFELHPANPAPYDVLLGRVGLERLLRAVYEQAPAGEVPGAGECRTFGATGQQLCGEFLAAWRGSGLDLDGDAQISEAESLARFGAPLTGQRIETLADGRAYLVQWFERARFELHPELAWPARVMFGLVGGELRPAPSVPPGDPRALTEPPAPLRIAAAPAPAAAGMRLEIPAIGLSRSVIPVGIDGNGAYEVPNHEVGWLSLSAAPGQGENIVLWGHVLPFQYAPQLPAPFARLRELAPGDRVVLYDADGRPFRYVITRQVWALPEQVEYVLPQGREQITMVSCIGDGVVVDGNIVDMSHRLITIAEPAP